MKLPSILTVALMGLALIPLIGCGTSTNLAGLGVSLDVAQKGLVAGVSFSAGSNSVTIGGSYQSGTNDIGGSVTVPTK